MPISINGELFDLSVNLKFSASIFDSISIKSPLFTSDFFTYSNRSKSFAFFEILLSIWFPPIKKMTIWLVLTVQLFVKSVIRVLVRLPLNRSTWSLLSFRFCWPDLILDEAWQAKIWCGEGLRFYRNFSWVNWNLAGRFLWKTADHVVSDCAHVVVNSDLSILVMLRTSTVTGHPDFSTSYTLALIM